MCTTLGPDWLQLHSMDGNICIRVCVWMCTHTHTRRHTHTVLHQRFIRLLTQTSPKSDLIGALKEHFLLQGIFPTQGSNPRLLHCKVDSLPTEPSRKSYHGVGCHCLLRLIVVRLANSQLHMYFKITFQKAWHWDFDWNCINFIQSFGKKLYPDNNNFPQQKHSLSLPLDGLSSMCFQ